MQSGLQGVLEPGRRQADQEDPRRQRHQVPERAFHDGLAAPGAGPADRVGAGPRHDHDEHGQPRRPRDQRHDDARGSEAGRRRVQQDRGGAKKAGLQQILHNEGFENSRLEDGRLTYPVLMEYLDPDLVKMQFQMSSMRTIGDPIMYFMNHPGRFISAHLQGVDTTQGMITSRAGFPPVKPTPEEAAAAAEGRGRGGRRWRWRRQCARRRRGHRRLAEGVHGREDRRPQELLRRTGLGHHGQERRLLEDSQHHVVNSHDRQRVISCRVGGTSMSSIHERARSRGSSRSARHHRAAAVDARRREAYAHSGSPNETSGS